MVKANAIPPAVAQPMLCTLVAEPFDNPAWAFEPKHVGLRVLGHFDGKEVILLSRNDQSQNLQFPDVAEALRDSLRRAAVLDGEVVCFEKHGRTRASARGRSCRLSPGAPAGQPGAAG
jgi:bifunctional non-homologous end joining protein LigD